MAATSLSPASFMNAKIEPASTPKGAACWIIRGRRKAV